MEYFRKVRACSTVAYFLYGHEIYKNITGAGVIGIYDHIWRNQTGDFNMPLPPNKPKLQTDTSFNIY